VIGYDQVVVAIASSCPRFLEAGWLFDVFDAARLGVEVEEIKEVEKVPVCIELEPDNPELHVPATRLHPFPQTADVEPQ
jgi:hypothetical protein